MATSQTQTLWESWQEMAAESERQKQREIPEDWQNCLREMVAAMHDYEMGAEEAPPYRHRAMMDRAHALLASVPKQGRTSAAHKSYLTALREIVNENEPQRRDLLEFLDSLEQSAPSKKGGVMRSKIGMRGYQEDCDL